MAVSVSYPGVYIDEVSSGVRPIESAGTSTAVFIGKTVKGPEGKPTLIFKWSDYDQFGGIRETVYKTDASDNPVLDADGNPIVDYYQPNDMGLAVYAFFLNGGGAAYIVNAGAGADSGTYGGVFTSLEKVRDINIICLPGQAWGGAGTGDAVIALAISHAEKMKNRMVIVDIDKNVSITDANDVEELALPTSIFSAAYYPWVDVANPHYKQEPGPSDILAAEKSFKIAPGGIVAGMWAKIDGRRGVWKAPAGVETALLGVAGLAEIVDDDLQGKLNPLGINCIRRIPGAGPVVWGARTLATKTDPEWRYVPVRRTASMIEESIYNNIQWAVFEPNDHRLWSSLRVNIGAFMNGLWRAGAFQGEKTSDAYFVRCNLGDTMTQDDIDLGKVIVEVGFAPLKPAEFVIIRIQQNVAQQ